MIRLDYRTPFLGGGYANVREDFTRATLWGLSRSVKANKHDASVVMEWP